jgi:hypothetical protein
MSKFFFVIFFTFLFGGLSIGYGQTAIDSTKPTMTFSGNIGITNNGFSIVPTFSLNRPAAIMNFSWRKNRFSIDPDIRLVSNMTKGGMLFWFRYRLVEKQKFKLRVGIHPAFSLVRKEITNNGSTTEITEMLRFIAEEMSATYQITPHWNAGLYYLQGNGLQKHGPQTTHVIFLNNNFTNIKLWGDFRFHFFHSFYYLNVDGKLGKYFTATGNISKMGLPFSLQGTINQTFTSNISGNKNFMWNVLLNYSFSKSYKRLK